MNMVSIIFTILGGLALFLYGLFILSNGFKKISGQKLKNILTKLTSNPLSGAGVGTFITSIIQSSSITVVTLIGLLNAGFLNLEQAISVMLGAEIGTTITAQIIAFKIGVYYLPIIVIGFILFFFFKRKNLQYLGQIILGFGILFLGMAIMGEGVKPLREMTFFIEGLLYFSQNILAGILAGAIFTAIIQSSSATIGLVIVMGMEGVINLPSAVALILGANIGTCVTGLFASIKSSLAAKRLAAAQLIINIFGVGVFAVIFPFFVKFVNLTTLNLPRQIANAHTIFNITVTLAMLPLISFLVLLVKKIIPGETPQTERGSKFINDGILNTPSIAILQAQKEILRMAKIAEEMLFDAKMALFKKDKDAIRSVQEKEFNVDELYHLIDDYLTKIVALDMSQENSKKLAQFIHSITDIERVADHAHNLSELAEFKIKNKIAFSTTGQKELNSMFDKTIEAFSAGVLSLENNNKKEAEKALELEIKVNELDVLLRKHHYERLKKNICKPEAGPIFLEIVSNLERISDHSENIAGGVLQGF